MNKLTKDPEKSQIRLKAWWEKEMVEAGLTGDVTVEYEPFEDNTESWSWGKTMWEALGGGDQLSLTHMYTASIPNAPWPLNTAALTARKGVVIYVKYAVTFPKKIPNELQVIMQDSKLRRECKFHGEDAERFNEQKDLVKQLHKSLSYFYQFWRTSIHTPFASYEMTPTEDGTEALVTTTLSGLFGFSKKRLGLAKILGGLDLLERAL